jgi:hypothetical protein
MSNEQLDYFIGFFGALSVYLILITVIYWIYRIFIRQYPIYTDKEIQEWNKEDMGNLPDAFYLSQEEINNLRNAKKELTDYGRARLRELLEKQKKEEDINN